MAYFKETRFKDFLESVKMDPKEKKKYIGQIKEDMKRNPVVHMEKEWGAFEELHDLSDEQIDEKAKEILSKMTLKQKVNQMSGDPSLDEIVLGLGMRYNETPYFAGEDKELGIPGIKFSDGPNGVVMYHSTAFPVSMARASTFNTELEKQVGDAIGKEIRAQGGNYYGGVCINLVRHPAWGRCQETYGEDPTLLGEMGYSLVKGVQKNDVMACVKHFATNSIENTRFEVNVDIDERSLREVYLPHFKRSIIDGGAASVMAAYNYLRGKPCGENGYLLKDILKKEWGFKGFVLSDFIFCVRHTADAAKNGMDVEMPTTIFWGNKLIEAVEKGEVPLEDINDSVLRILREKIRFASKKDAKKCGKEIVSCPEHTRLATKVAEESFVLLKNENGMLPIDRNKTGKIAVIGKLAIEANIGGGLGSCAVRPPYIVTPIEGIKNKAGNVDIVYNDGSDIASAAKDAAGADKVIIVTGLTCNDEGECMDDFVDGDPDKLEGTGGDRKTLKIHDHDIELIEACADANPNTVVCLTGGSSVIMNPWNKKPAAILLMWYPGMEGGNALANILFGDACPSGKLPITIPADPSQLPDFEINAVHADYGYYHGYFLADKEKYKVEYPFGFGLSYTNFEYGNLRLSQSQAAPGETITASIDVTNTGKREGKESVQLYAGYVNPTLERHVKDLKGFTKVSIAPGKTKTVEIPLKINDLAYYDPEAKKFVVDKITYKIMAGPSSQNEKLKTAELKVI